MRYGYWISLVAFCVPGLCFAQSNQVYSCVNGALERRVEIVYEQPEAPVPCEVRYSKLTEQPGQTQTLWSANNQEGYCESKTDEFLQRLQWWGWICRGIYQVESRDHSQGKQHSSRPSPALPRDHI